MNLKNLLFEEQSKLVCTLKQHKKKCNVSLVPLCLILLKKKDKNLHKSCTNHCCIKIFVEFSQIFVYFVSGFRLMISNKMSEKTCPFVTYTIINCVKNGYEMNFCCF